MNHDSNREDHTERKALRYYGDQNGLGWFGCNIEFIRPMVICISCGAKGKSAETMPCPCAQTEEA